MNDLNKRGFLSVLKEQIRSNHRVFVVWASLRLIVIAALVLSAIRQDYESVFICVLTLLLFLIPSLIQRNLDIQFPTTLQIVILLHIFAAQILGELSSYYIHFKHWDTILHTVWGFLCAALGYSLVDILNEDNNFHVKLSPLYLAIASFCFSMTIGVFWEFFEFAADRLLLIDMQKDTVVPIISTVMLDESRSNIPIIIDGIRSVSINGQDLGLGGYLDIGLYDTMEDLIVNFIGALVFSVIGYFSSKKDSRSRFAFHFIPRLKE
ncbi:MAG: hypothetical protein IJ364_07090 [Oscillospiraceae bacterium]|nr:hypothetical protein [Oscillospiraceae bacterium]